MEIISKKKLLNIIGLLFGMVGVVIIFIYGPPQPSFFPFTIITDSQVNKEILELKQKYDLYSKIGLGLIFIGFLFQLLAVIISDKISDKSEDKIGENIRTMEGD